MHLNKHYVNHTNMKQVYMNCASYVRALLTKATAILMILAFILGSFIVDIFPFSIQLLMTPLSLSSNCILTHVVLPTNDMSPDLAINTSDPRRTY